MKKTLFASCLALSSIFSTHAMASTISITEGKRDLVAGSVAQSDAGNRAENARDLGAVDNGPLEVYGRVVDTLDNFLFSASQAFSISWIFGGYLLADNAFVAASGFVSEGLAQKSSTFRLLDANSGFSVVAAETFGTGLTSGNPVLFSAGPGDYVLQIDGSGANAPGQGVGLFDIRIATTPSVNVQIAPVPLPASSLALLGGLAGLGWVGRRKAR